MSTFNLGTGIGHSILELIKAFERTSGLKIPYKIGPRRDDIFSICYSNLDKSKLILTGSRIIY